MSVGQVDFNRFKALIMTRRAIRQFKDVPVSDSDILDILETGVWAPSGSNMNARYFVVVRDINRIVRIRALSPGMFSSPRALIVLCTDKKRAMDVGGKQGMERLSVMDIALSAQNIFLAAWNKGIGTCPVGGFNAAAVSKILDLPDHIRPDLVIAMGYPDEHPEAPEKPDVKEVTFFEQFGRKEH